MLPLHKRTYNIGDVVLLLGYGNPEQLASMRAMATTDRWSADWARRNQANGTKLLLLEGVVDTIAAPNGGGYDDEARNGAYINIRFTRDAGIGDVGLHLDRGSTNYSLITCANNINRLTQENAAQGDFLLDFVYPVVVASQGYNSMLRDLAIAVGREPAAVNIPTDAVGIYARAEELQIPIIKLPSKHITQGFQQADHDTVETQVATAKATLAALIAARPVGVNPAPQMRDDDVRMVRWGMPPAPEDGWNLAAQAARAAGDENR